MNSGKKISKSLNTLLQKINLPSYIKETLVYGLSLDTRNIRKDEIFFALKGQNFDGNNYIDDAIKKGALIVLSDNPNLENNRQVFYYPDLLKEIANISSIFYDHPSQKLDIFCATGTNGKTSFVESLSQISQNLGIKCGFVSTISTSVGKQELVDSILTTPNSINLNRVLSESLSNNCKIAAIEASSHGIVQKRLEGIKIKVAVLTSFSQDHLDYHKTIAAYEAAKQSFFFDNDIESSLINIDSDFGARLYTSLKLSKKLVYSISIHKESDFKISFTRKNLQNIYVTIDSPFGSINFYVNTFSKMMASNVAIAVASFLITGVPLDVLANKIQDVFLPKGRMELVKINKNSYCIIDFAHTPEALSKSILEIKQSFSGKLWCIFGCGGDRDQKKRSLMGKIAEDFSDFVVLTNDNPRFESPKAIIANILEGMEKPELVFIQEDRYKAINFCLKKIISQKDPINLLIAGKGHEDFQLVNGSSINFNDKKVVLNLLNNS